jgi:hypothetical protein
MTDASVVWFACRGSVQAEQVEEREGLDADLSKKGGAGRGVVVVDWNTENRHTVGWPSSSSCGYFQQGKIRGVRAR